MKKVTFFLVLGFVASSLAGEPPKQPGPFKPAEFYNEVHQRVMREMEARRLPTNFMLEAIQNNDSEAALQAFSPFRPIAVEAGAELARRNNIKPEDATMVALRAIVTNSVFARACEAGGKDFKAAPLDPKLFAPEFPREYSPGSEFSENRMEPTDSVSGAGSGLSVGTQKIVDGLNLPPSIAKTACPIGENVARNALDPERLEGLKNAVKNEVEKAVKTPEKPSEVATEPKPAAPVTPVTRPTPMEGQTQPFSTPIAKNDGIRPEPKGNADSRPEPTEELALGGGGSATHRGVASPPTETAPLNASIRREERLSQAAVDSIIQQTLNDKLLTRDIDRRTADELAERLSSAYKREGDLTTAFAQVQKEITDTAVAHPAKSEEKPADGNARVSPFSGTPEEGLLKEFTAKDLKEKPQDKELAATPTAPTYVGIGPAAGIIPVNAAGASGDNGKLALGSALNAKNALQSDEEVNVGNPKMAVGEGGGSLQDGKASGWGSDYGGGAGGALGTLVAGGKAERPSLQTVKSRIQNFLESVAKTFKPRSLSGGALRGVASVNPSEADAAHGEDETTLALASFGESSGEWSGADVPNVWIPIGFFLGTFGITLGAFLAWQRWRGRKSTHGS